MNNTFIIAPTRRIRDDNGVKAAAAPAESINELKSLGSGGRVKSITGAGSGKHYEMAGQPRRRRRGKSGKMSRQVADIFAAIAPR